jgi:hypothetical protein
MNRSMQPFVIAGLVCGLAFAAQAQPPAAPAESEAAAATKAELKAHNCLLSTGSRIVAAHNQRHPDRKRCVNAAGRVYDQDDLRRTGETNVADALRKLDPAIQ